MEMPQWSRPFADRLDVLRRDLHTVLLDLRGQHAPPFVARQPLQRHHHVIRPPVLEPVREPLLEPATTPQPLTIRCDGHSYQGLVAPDQTLLEAGLDAGAPMPFSCTAGGCGTCRARLISGQVVIAEPNCLSPEERAAGYVLPCVSRPAGPTVLEVE